MNKEAADKIFLEYEIEIKRQEEFLIKTGWIEKNSLWSKENDCDLNLDDACNKEQAAILKEKNWSYIFLNEKIPDFRCRPPSFQMQKRLFRLSPDKKLFNYFEAIEIGVHGVLEKDLILCDKTIRLREIILNPVPDETYNIEFKKTSDGKFNYFLE